MAKYSIYAVGRGIDPNTKQPVSGLKVATWKECEPYVKGVEGARFKGFLTDSEADAWLAAIANEKEKPVSGGSSVSNSQQSSMVHQTVKHDAQDADINAIRSRFVEICKLYNIMPNDMVNKIIADFVSTYDFTHPAAGEPFTDEDIYGALPFN